MEDVANVIVLRKSIYVGIIVVFISMFFIFFVFDAVSKINVICIREVCDRMTQILYMLFGMIISGIFAVITVGTARMLLSESGYKEPEAEAETMDVEIELSNLEREYEDILKAMDITKNDYKEGRISSDTLDVLTNEYKVKMVRIKRKMEKLQKKIK